MKNLKHVIVTQILTAIYFVCLFILPLPIKTEFFNTFFKGAPVGLHLSYIQVTNEVKSERLKRYTVPLDEQDEMESAWLWRHVRCVVVLF